MRRFGRSLGLVGLLLAAALLRAHGGPPGRVLYDSRVTRFGDWRTDHPLALHPEKAGLAYRYSLTDAANDYAYVPVDYRGESFRLTFDVFPIRTGWAGNFRLGLWDRGMRVGTPSSLYVEYARDDNGYHLQLLCYSPEGGWSWTPGTRADFSDGVWYHTEIEYSAPQRSATCTVTGADGRAWRGTIEGLGLLPGLDRLALTSVGDDGYPGSTAEGLIRNVRLETPPFLPRPGPGG
jgi:hypothetical protein